MVGERAGREFFDLDLGGPEDVDGSGVEVECGNMWRLMGEWNYWCRYHPLLTASAIVRPNIHESEVNVFVLDNADFYYYLIWSRSPKKQKQIS